MSKLIVYYYTVGKPFSERRRYHAVPSCLFAMRLAETESCAKSGLDSSGVEYILAHAGRQPICAACGEPILPSS